MDPLTAAVALRSATDLAALLRERELSSRELLDLYLDRVERLNPSINAVVTVDAERARRRAEAADDAIARGRSWGPLHGLPITIKDALAVAGMRSTGGATELRDYVPTRSAPVVARLRNAGAIVFGKTNAPKWSLDYVTTNELFGTTNNPWNAAHVPGGSSGGAAAAVSAGLSAFDIGTDLGGSIRLPSHFCGVYGLKPSFGAVSQRGYVDRVGEARYDVDGNHFGPITRSVADLALLYRLLAVHPTRGAEPKATLADYRIAAWLDDEACPVDTPVLACLTRAVDAVGAGNATIDDSRPTATLREARALVGRVIAAGLRGPQPFASPERTLLHAAWSAWFADHDVMLWPVAPTTAPAHDERSIVDRRITINGVEVAGVETIGWTGPINVLGLPSVVVPVGVASDGLPVGMQVIAAWGNDRVALDVAARIDAVLREQGIGYAAPPPFADA
jgi:amidase